MWVLEQVWFREKEQELVIARVPLVELSQAVILTLVQEKMREQQSELKVERVPNQTAQVYSLRLAVPATQRNQQ